MAVYPEQTNHRTAFKYEGHLHEFEAPNIALNKCRKFGGVILSSTALEQIAEAFRGHAKLLTAEKIREELQRLKLSQKEFGELLGVARRDSLAMAKLRPDPDTLARQADAAVFQVSGRT